MGFRVGNGEFGRCLAVFVGLSIGALRFGLDGDIDLCVRRPRDRWLFMNIGTNWRGLGRDCINKIPDQVLSNCA